MANAVFVDKRRMPGSITVIDLLSASANLYLEDLYETTRRIEKRAGEGLVPGPSDFFKEPRLNSLRSSLRRATLRSQCHGDPIASLIPGFI